MTADEPVVVSTHVARELQKLGFDVDAEVAAVSGEPPRVPRWVKIVWDSVKEGLIEGVPVDNGGRASGLLVAQTVNRLFKTMREDRGFRTHVLVILACLDDSVDRVKAVFDLAFVGVSIFCAQKGCGARLDSFEDVRAGLCPCCRWHKEHYEGFE